MRSQSIRCRNALGAFFAVSGQLLLRAWRRRARVLQWELAQPQISLGSRSRQLSHLRLICHACRGSGGACGRDAALGHSVPLPVRTSAPPSSTAAGASCFTGCFFSSFAAGSGLRSSVRDLLALRAASSESAGISISSRRVCRFFSVRRTFAGFPNIPNSPGEPISRT